MVKLLIVENGTIPEAAYKDKFGKAGFDILLTANVGEALQKLPDYNPDMFIFDMNLPDMDGVAVINSIVQTCKSLPIIINSAQFSFDGEINCWGSKTHVVNSANPDELKCKMSAFLSEEHDFTVLLPIGNDETQQLVFFSK
jgi:DNA-binding response OmpR family regulator